MKVNWCGWWAGGDRLAFQALYRAYFPRLARFLDRMTRNVPLLEEVVNDTMLVVWQKGGPATTGSSKVSTWIFGIAYRHGPEGSARPRRAAGRAARCRRRRMGTSLSTRWLRCSCSAASGRALDALPLEQRAVVALTLLPRHGLPGDRGNHGLPGKYREDAHVPCSPALEGHVVRPFGRIEMNMQDPSNVAEHQDMQALLPWYAAGSLADSEAERVQRHLRDCPGCRAELAWQRRLIETAAPLPAALDQERALARLMARLGEAPLAVAKPSRFGAAMLDWLRGPGDLERLGHCGAGAGDRRAGRQDAAGRCSSRVPSARQRPCCDARCAGGVQAGCRRAGRAAPPENLRRAAGRGADCQRRLAAGC
ncbi:zf-HC2 domain-containing protein [Massilia eburnea]|uniref:RNA polymerase sigma factor n=1 Tax=Massilia eburnea TaxID=1776165 RepID=UPI003D6A1468